MRILVVNAGSSSLKLRLLGSDDELLAEADVAAPRAQVDPAEIESALVGDFGTVDAVGHRIVHGGHRFRDAVHVDAAVRAALDELVDLAPLHQPKSLAALDAVARLLPRAPAVACFDTAFHADLPAAAATYALPRAWRQRWGVRRFGFHGLSHAYAARRAAEVVGRPPEDPDVRIVTCHLGAGASLAAVRGGRSVDTTMGFTPLEGLVMATRSGSVDPGLLLWLLERERLGLGEMSQALEHESGLAGLAGTPDMREVLEHAAQGDRDSRLAVDVYLHRLRGQIAAMAATLGGVDVLAFTGGVGERSDAIRAAAAEPLAFLGIAVDAVANVSVDGDAIVSPSGAAVATVVVHAREDLEIARQVRRILAA